MWMRRSSGHYCADLIHLAGKRIYLDFMYLDVISDWICDRPAIFSLRASTSEAMVIEFLPLKQYHGICYWNLSQRPTFSIARTLTVNMGAVFSCPSSGRREDAVEIASFLSPGVYGSRWYSPWSTSQGAAGVVTKDGWTRYEYFILLTVLIVFNSFQVSTLTLC
jgi:hypothetical protein